MEQNDTKKVTLKDKKLNFLHSYIEKMGNISQACEDVGISRKTYYRWMKVSKFRDEFNVALEKHNDLIFQRILNLALKEDKDMLKFWAKTQMRHRGFVERQELDVSDERTRIIIEKADDANNKVETEPEAGASSGDPK